MIMRSSEKQLRRQRTIACLLVVACLCFAWGGCFSWTKSLSTLVSRHGIAHGRHSLAPRERRARDGSFVYAAPERNPSQSVQAAESETSPALSSVSQSTVNLVKNIVGSGMLSLPAGVAAFSGSPAALIPSTILALTLCLMSAFCFVLIADACSWTGESTYQGAWAKTVSPRSKILPAAACLAKALIGCISYSMILGDCLSLILAPFGLPPVLASRSSAMLFVTLTMLLPLCSLRSLAPMAKFSVLGVLSNVYTCLFIVFRCFDGSYSEGGALLSAAPAMPQFSTATSILGTCMTPSIAILLSILATAFLAHYNAPLFYEQLDPGPNDDKSRRFLIVSVLGFLGSGLIFSLVMVGGFLTFGSNSAGLILNSYAANDHFAILARLAICVSLLTAYPIVFFSLRKQLLGLFGAGLTSFATAKYNLTTVVLLSVVTAIALRLHNLGKLAAFAGACFGSFLIYIAPALMVLRGRQRGIGPKFSGLSGKASQASLLSTIIIGVVLGVIGASQTLK